MPGEKNFFQTFGEAFVKGDIFTKVSLLVWGLGYIGHGQLMKALLVTLVEGLGLYFLAFYGAPNLAKFGTLGTVKMEMVFDVTTMKNVVNNYDNSFEILLMSMISFVVIAALIAAAMMVVTSNYQLQKIRAAGKKTNNFLQDINVYLNEKFYVTLLTLPVLGVVVFTIVPLFILIAVAFTPDQLLHAVWRRRYDLDLRLLLCQGVDLDAGLGVLCHLYHLLRRHPAGHVHQ